MDTAGPLGHTITDRYRIEHEIGRGGMAIVYLAHDLKHDREVALKVPSRELSAGVGAERFAAEIRVTANLQHPHLLPLFDSGVVPDEQGQPTGCPYYVMPYVAGTGGRGVGLIFLAREPMFNALRGAPRFERILERVGVVQ